MLNNDAFRALVHKPLQEGKSKITKDIVREAVEAEFSQKKYRKKKLRGNNDDDDDDDYGQHTSRKKGKQLWQEKNNGHSNLSTSIRYRDRALERRKGLSDVDVLKEDMVLGNFESDKTPTNVARGQEEAERYENTFENGIEQANTNDLNSKTNSVVKWTEMSDAEMMRRLETLTSHSDLGRSVLCFLKKKHLHSKAVLPIPVQKPQLNPAINAIHRSTILFNLEGNIHKTQDAWEIPSTCVYSEIETERRNRPCCMMSLDRRLIARIKAVSHSQYKEFEEVSLYDFAIIMVYLFRKYMLSKTSFSPVATQRKEAKNTMVLDRKGEDSKSDLIPRNSCVEVEDSDDIF